MRMNSQMKLMWDGLSTRLPDYLPEALANKLDSKFIDVVGCTLLQSMIPSNELNVLTFENEGNSNQLPADLRERIKSASGYENFIHKIHIEDFVKEHYLAYALKFLDSVFTKFREDGHPGILRGIVSIDDEAGPDSIFSCCVSYHLVREDDSLLSDNIEAYSPFAVLEIDSNESLEPMGLAL